MTDDHFISNNPVGPFYFSNMKYSIEQLLNASKLEYQYTCMTTARYSYYIHIKNHEIYLPANNYCCMLA
jgi:hypothetical protein